MRESRVFTPVGEVQVDPARAVVHEEGWQSWSATSTYRLDQRPWRGTDAVFHPMNYKDPAGLHAGLAGEGLLAVDPGTGGPGPGVSGAAPTPPVPAGAAPHARAPEMRRPPPRRGLRMVARAGFEPATSGL